MSFQLGGEERVPHIPFLQLFSTPAVMRSVCIGECMPEGAFLVLLFFNPRFADLRQGDEEIAAGL